MNLNPNGKYVAKKGGRGVDLNTIFTAFCLTLAFVLTILLSFGARFLFRPNFDSTFWGDFAVACALCVYCVYFGIPEGKNYYHKKENGRYQKAVSAFESAREQVVHNDFAFTQWLQRYYEKNKLDFYKAVLSSHGNINAQVLDLDVHEIDKLANPYKKVWDDTEFKGRAPTYFRSLDEKQIRLVKDIFAGHINFSRIPDDFFKTMNGKVVTSEYARQAEENKKRSWGYFAMILGRLLMVFLFAFVFSAFAIQVSNAGSGEEIMQRTITTFSRIWTMASSFVYGLSLGRIMVMDESQTIEYKARVNQEFTSDKSFKPLSEEDEAKKEYEDYQRKQEEAKANVVVPTQVASLTYNEEEGEKANG